MNSLYKNSFKFPFEKLEVWKKSIDLATTIYKLTSTFPKTEMYGLSSQIQRAAVSVSSNIAEGSVRFSAKEQVRFYEVAFGSLMEVISQTILAKKLNYISDENFVEIRSLTEEISRMLNALSKSKNDELSE